MRTYTSGNKNAKYVSNTTYGLAIITECSHPGRERHTVKLTVLYRGGSHARCCVIEFPVSDIPELLKDLQEVYNESQALERKC